MLLLFQLVVWTYTLITFLPQYLVKWMTSANGGFCSSLEERAKRIKAHSVSGSLEGPYRAVNAAKTLVSSMHPGVDTLDKLLEHAVTRFPRRDCLGTREVISEEGEKQADGKVFKKVRKVVERMYGILLCRYKCCKRCFLQIHDLNTF